MQESTPRHTEPLEGSSNRSFGLVFAVFFLVVALLPVLHGDSLRLWAVYISSAFGVIAFIVPAVLSPFNRLWTVFGMMLHRIVSPVALGILFFCVVTPIALLMRLLGEDPLRLKLDKAASSYWIDRAPPGPDADSLKNQF